MADVILYTTPTCGDCRRIKQFLRDRGVASREVNIEGNPQAEATVLRANGGRRCVPTIEVDGRFHAGSPFDPHRLAQELGVSLSPSG